MTEAEWLTRKNRIDRRLRATTPPWTIVRYQPGLELTSLDVCAVEECPTESGPADYSLIVEGRWLGIIEAKKVGTGPANVIEQARRYARGASPGSGQWNGYRVPFLYATNGEVIWHADERAPNALSCQVPNLPSPAELADRFSRDLVGAATRLSSTPTGAIARLRPYQTRCIESVESRLATGLREMLVAMATGTGKTFLTVAQVYRLLEAGFARRVLFLVDRKALSEQHEIVRRVDMLFALADRIEARFQQAKAQVDRLKPALLAMAFRGELVPQDPNDEPAAALLERIRSFPAESRRSPAAPTGPNRRSRTRRTVTA